MTRNRRTRPLAVLALGAMLLTPACAGPYDRGRRDRSGEVAEAVVTTAVITAAFVTLWHGFCHCCHHVGHFYVHHHY